MSYLYCAYYTSKQFHIQIGIFLLLEELWNYFPKGYLTEEEFLAKFHESEIFGKDSNFSPAKHLFSIIDRDKSGMSYTYS